MKIFRNGEMVDGAYEYNGIEKPESPGDSRDLVVGDDEVELTSQDEAEEGEEADNEDVNGEGTDESARLGLESRIEDLTLRENQKPED